MDNFYNAQDREGNLIFRISVKFVSHFSFPCPGDILSSFWFQVGMHVNQLVPANVKPSVCPRRSSGQSSHHPGGSHSVRNLFQVQKAKKSTEEEHKEGGWFSVPVFCIGMALHFLTNLHP